MLVQKMILNAIAKQFRLDEVLDYVFKPNKNNEDIIEMKDDIKILKAIAHPQREYVRCLECNCKIKEK